MKPLSWSTAGLLLMVFGCQQNPVSFTPAQAARAIPVVPLTAAPPVAETPALALSAPHTEVVGEAHYLHYFYRPELSQTDIRLIRLNHDAYGSHADVLIGALKERQLDDMRNSPWQFSKYWTAQATPHYLQFRASVFDIELHAAAEYFMQLWLDFPLAEIDPDQVKRQLKIHRQQKKFFGTDYYKWWNQLSLGRQHPYLQLASAPPLIDTISAPMLSNLWQQHRQASSWHLLVASPIPKSAMHQQFAQRLVRLPVKNVRKESTPELPRQSPWLFHVLDAPGTVQSQFTIGYAQRDTSADASFACAVIGEWLGSSFTGRLFADLREQRGLAYSVGGSCEQKPLALMLRFGGSTRLENTGAFLHGVLDHFRLAKEQPIQAAELHLLKQRLLGEWRVALDTVDGQLDTYTQLLQMQRDWSQLSRREERLKQLTAGELQDMATSLLGGHPVVVIRGDADKISADLRAKFPQAQIVVSDQVPD